MNEKTLNKKYIKNVHYKIKKKKNKTTKQKINNQLNYTALLLWLQSRLNNFTAFYSHPKNQTKNEMSKSRGIMAPFSLLKSRNRNEQSFLHQNSPSLIYYITRTGDYLYRCTMVFILTLYTKFTFKLDLYYRK